jgi:hypothetical protein
MRLRNDVAAARVRYERETAMPRYYFHAHNSVPLIDSDGTVLDNPKSAFIHALQVVRELMFKRAGMLGQPWSAWTMRVNDKNGKTLHTIPFSDLPEHNTQH